MTKITDKVLGFAQKDDRVRWVVLTGSRTNPDIPRDAYQDYDIQMGVNQLDSFLKDDAWLDQFGERAIMQKPEAMSLFEPSLGGRFTYLMQFVDGSRLDLMLVPLDKEYPLDINTQVLLDKDGLIDLSKAEVIEYWDTSENVLDCMNEFLWLSYYVVKGVKRGQIIYAQDHLATMRSMVLQMYAWKTGGNPGLSYKYLEPKLPKKIQKRIYDSYFNKDILSAMLGLFEAMKIASETYDYDQKEFDLVLSQHLKIMI